MSNYYISSKELNTNKIKNHITESYDIIKTYIKTRYSHEVELSKFIESTNKEIVKIKIELNESAISIRRITDTLKLITAKTEEGKGKFSNDRFFAVLISSLENEATINLYLSEKQLILESVNKIVKLNESLSNYKENNNIVLKQLRDDITNAGIPFNIIKIKYNEFKLNLQLLESEAQSDIELFRSDKFKEVMTTFDLPFVECFEEISKEKLKQKILLNKIT